ANSAISVDGVMGYPAKNFIPALKAPATHASFPCINLTVIFLILLNINCKIRTSHFTQFTIDTFLKVLYSNDLLFHFQHIFWTCGNANTTSFAPVLAYNQGLLCSYSRHYTPPLNMLIFYYIHNIRII